MKWADLVDSSDIDIIAVAVPPIYQREILSAAISAGKPVFAEKPLSCTLSEAEHLTELAESNTLPNMIDFEFPELKTWKQAKLILDQHELGVLRHVFIDWRMESYDIKNKMIGWKTNSEVGGGVLSHFGCHTLNYLEWFLGPITQLSASLSSSTGEDNLGDTLAAISFQSQRNISGCISLCNAAFMGAGHRIEFHGDKGTLNLINQGSDPVNGFRLYRALRSSDQWELLSHEVQSETTSKHDSRVTPVASLVARFIDWIHTGVPTSPNFRDGLRSQQLVDAAIGSSRQGGASVNI